MKCITVCSISTLTVITFAACAAAPNGSVIDREAARKLSDSFMSDLVLNRVSDAVGLMEPELAQKLGPAEAEAQIRKLFEYCGGPLDREFKREESGFKIYPNGHKKPVRKFYYAARTDQFAKGVCFFSISVVPSPSGLKVTEYGPLKLLTGQLPDWLK
jgi:hypothetical protein